MIDAVACLGILVADVVGKPVDTLPERGRLQLVDRIELHPGGCAANTGIALAKLGVRTSIAGKVGSDGFGDFLVGELRRHGLNVDGVVRDMSAATSATMVLVHGDGERSFIHYLGANATYGQDDVPRDFGAGVGIAHVAGALVTPALDGEPMARVLASARARGARTALDTVWDATGGWMKTLAPCLEHVYYFLPNTEEAQMLTGGVEDPDEQARILLDAGPQVVGIKCAARGSVFRTRAGDAWSVPPLPVHAVDSLGAGDAFVAGFLAATVRGWSPRDASRLASAAGACCVTALGATTGVRGFEETAALAEAITL